MSEMTGVGESAPPAPTNNGSGSAPEPTLQGNNGDNPAWSDLLNAVPSQFHNMLKPHLQKWDQGVQQKFQQVHSQYEPWKQFMDAGLTPDEIGYALNIMNTINQDPQKVYDLLGQHLGVAQNGSEDEQGDADSEEEEEYVDPRIQQLEEGYKTLAQITLAQHQERENAQADKELDEYLTKLRTDLGDYDEKYVLALMGSGVSGEDAVKQFQDIITKAKTEQNRPPTPTVMSPGGGLPSQAVNPSAMEPKDRKALLASMLEKAAEQNRL